MQRVSAAFGCYGDWKLELMADTLFEQLLGDKHQIVKTALELLKKYYKEASRKDQQGNSERKIQLKRIENRLRNLTVMRADGEIGKEEYQKLREQLEAVKSRLEKEQKKAESVKCREAMDLDRIQQALEELIHLKGKGVSRELIDQIVYRVTAGVRDPLRLVPPFGPRNRCPGQPSGGGQEGKLCVLGERYQRVLKPW